MNDPLMWLIAFIVVGGIYGVVCTFIFIHHRYRKIDGVLYRAWFIYFPGWVRIKNGKVVDKWEKGGERVFRPDAEYQLTPWKQYFTS